MIRLHHCHQTRSMRSLWLLHEIGAPFVVQVHAFDKTLRDKDYLAVNPAGRVPALEIDDRIICESGAIAEVLCERFPEAGLGRFPGDAERYDWLNWVHFAETISQHTAALTQQHVALYEDHMRSPIIMQLEAKRLEKCLAVVDKALAGKEYLLPSGFSAADVGVGQAVYMARHFVRTEVFAEVSAWFARITARRGFAASLPGPNDARLYKADFYSPWRDGAEDLR